MAELIQQHAESVFKTSLDKLTWFLANLTCFRSEIVHD